MRGQGTGLTVALTLLVTCTAAAQLNLGTQSFPTVAGAERVFNETLSYENALRSTERIKDIVASFRTLTEQARSRFTEDELRAIGNTGREIQSPGFQNWPTVVEATLRKQEYQLQQLAYELATHEFALGDISAAEFNEVALAAREAELEFQEFWNSLRFSG